MKKSATFALRTALVCALSPVIPVDAEDASSSNTLQEIVITAQRREQSLQDVPISVTAMTGEAIENGGFADVQDMANFVPNLFMRDHITSQSIVIRGIGTATGNEAFEQAVSQFVDGVYYGRDNLGQNAVFDVERIEVVRGPQPIFAGQSSTAGAINVINRRPGKALEGSASVAYGSDKEYSFDGAIGGPVTDTVGARVSGRYYELGDTQYHNPALNNEPVGVKRNKAVRLITTWTPSDAIDFTFKYEHQDVWQRGTGGEPVDCELRPQYSRASSSVAPGLPALCALDAVVLGANLSKLNGDAFTGGVYDARAAVDALNAASGAAPGSPNYWGYNSGPGVTGLQALAYGLNQVK
jgi:outer membrane receptor protein involved in Fe transport